MAGRSLSTACACLLSECHEVTGIIPVQQHEDTPLFCATTFALLLVLTTLPLQSWSGPDWPPVGGMAAPTAHCFNLLATASLTPGYVSCCCCTRVHRLPGVCIKQQVQHGVQRCPLQQRLHTAGAVRHWIQRHWHQALQSVISNILLRLVPSLLEWHSHGADCW